MVYDSIISNNVTIISVLHSDMIVSEINSEWVVRMDHINNYKTMLKFVKVMQRKLYTLLFPDKI